MVHQGSVEQKTRARGTGDGESVPGERAQNSMGVIKELNSLVAGVSDDRGDLQTVRSIGVDVWSRGPDGQAGSKGGRGYGVNDDVCDKGDEGSTEESREHHNDEGVEGN